MKSGQERADAMYTCSMYDPEMCVAYMYPFIVCVLTFLVVECVCREYMLVGCSRCTFRDQFVVEQSGNVFICICIRSQTDM